MTDKLLTEHHLEFLHLKGDCKCSSESSLVKMPHCWKSHVTAHLYMTIPYRNVTVECMYMTEPYNDKQQCGCAS